MDRDRKLDTVLFGFLNETPSSMNSICWMLPAPPALHSCIQIHSAMIHIMSSPSFQTMMLPFWNFLMKSDPNYKHDHDEIPLFEIIAGNLYTDVEAMVTGHKVPGIIRHDYFWCCDDGSISQQYGELSILAIPLSHECLKILDNN